MKLVLAALFATALIIFTVMMGIYIGAPLAAEYYKLELLSEVKQLFVLLPVGYFYITIPVVVLFAAGFWLALKRYSMTFSVLYGVSVFIAYPVLFYGLTVSNYYG